MSYTYHNTHTLSQSTPSLYHITSTLNTLSLNTPTQAYNIPIRNTSTSGGREGGTDNGMGETKVGEREGERGKWVGREAERRIEAGSNRSTEYVNVRKTGGRVVWREGWMERRFEGQLLVVVTKS